MEQSMIRSKFIGGKLKATRRKELQKKSRVKTDMEQSKNKQEKHSTKIEHSLQVWGDGITF
jgi:hypothetical protein